MFFTVFLAVLALLALMIIFVLIYRLKGLKTAFVATGIAFVVLATLFIAVINAIVRAM